MSLGNRARFKPCFGNNRCDWLPSFFFIIYRHDTIFLLPCFFLYILLLLFYRCCLCVEIQEKKTYIVHRPKVPWTWFLFFFSFLFFDFISYSLFILLFYYQCFVFLFYYSISKLYAEFRPDFPQLALASPSCPQIWTENCPPAF